jgi:modulator of FtsH protease HflK
MLSKLKGLGITGVAIIITAIIFILSGLYIVNSGEEAVILRFGAFQSVVTDAGAKWRIPFIDKVYKANVSEISRLEFGFNTVEPGSSDSTAKYSENLSEALMLTGDENLALVEVIIQYKIIDAKKYFFNVDSPITTLRVISESSIRRAIASHKLDEALTDNKFGIQQEIKESLQRICDKYEIGIAITAIQLQDVNPPREVDAAFKDVSSALEDKNSEINKANSYRNEKIPAARGNAAQRINEAEGYKSSRIDYAKGDVANFLQILDKYQQGKQVTRTRMYLEMMERVLPSVDKYIVDESGNTVKFLPLSENTVIPNP